MNCAGYSESDFVVINDRGTRYVLDIQPLVYHCVGNTLAYYDDESGGIKHVKCKDSNPIYENKVYTSLRLITSWCMKTASVFIIITSSSWYSQ
jgi:hypothetical protein